MRNTPSVASPTQVVCPRGGRRARTPIAVSRSARTACDGSAQGERRLALAVLTEAVRCFQENAESRDPRRRRLFDEAEQWLMGRNADPEFSFEEICNALKLDPSYLRNGLQRWRERQRVH